MRYNIYIYKCNHISPINQIIIFIKIRNTKPRESRFKSKIQDSLSVAISICKTIFVTQHLADLEHLILICNPKSKLPLQILYLLLQENHGSSAEPLNNSR